MQKKTLCSPSHTEKMSSSSLSPVFGLVASTSFAAESSNVVSSSTALIAPIAAPTRIVDDDDDDDDDGDNDNNDNVNDDGNISNAEDQPDMVAIDDDLPLERDTTTYITHLHVVHSSLLATTSVGLAELLDASTLQRVRSLNHVKATASSVLHGAATLNDAVLTCGNNGTLAEWDVRLHGDSPVCVFDARAVSPNALACALDDDLNVALCCGSGGVVQWFDRRTRRALRVLRDLHSDDASALLSVGGGIAYSGGDDALLCELQLDGLASAGDDAADDDAANDDDAYLRGCIQVGDAVQSLTVCGAQGDSIACLSNLAISVWDRGTLASRFAITDHRSATAAAAAIPVDYTVGLHFDAPSDQLWALVGNDSGTALLLGAVTPERIVPLATLNGGHTARVRAFLAVDSDTIFTGGEDARICAWRRGVVNNAATVASPAEGPMRRTHRPVATARLNPF
jgi:hypothetical protein